jgi:hypothetical protein
MGMGQGVGFGTPLQVKGFRAKFPEFLSFFNISSQHFKDEMHDTCTQTVTLNFARSLHFPQTIQRNFNILYS